MLERLQQLRRHALLLRPGEREALDAVRVGVLRRGEAALGQPQLAHHVVERLLDDRAIPRLARDDERVQVGGGEQRVVVEHLLEVRHEPALVDRVAVEAAADEVVHPAGRHPVERLRHHRHRLRRAAAQQELERRGGRELRRPPEAAVDGLERARDPALGLVEQRRRERLGGRLDPGRVARRLDEPARLRDDVVPLRLPGLGHREQELGEATAGRAAARAGSRCRRRTARPPGVRKTVIGQPPCPVIETVASM